MTSLGRAVLRLAADGTDLGRELNEAEKKTEATFKRLGDRARVLGTGLLAFGVPVVAALGISIKTFAEFEQSMAQVQAVSNATADEFTALTAIAREMGETTVFTAREAAKALSFMSMAGLTASESVAALPDVLNLAAAGQLALGDAADIVTNVMAGYGIEAENVTEATDVLVTGFTSANTDLTQLGQAFKFAGPVASAAGIQFEETAAALSIMGNAGFQASVSGTALRGAITRLLNPVGESVNILNRLGVQVTNSAGDLLPLVDIVGQFEEVGLSAGDAMTLFGQRAGPGILSLVQQGSGALRELTADMENSGGTAQRIADTQLNTFSGQMKLAASAVEGLQLSIGGLLVPILRGVIGPFISVIKTIQEWAEENPRLFRTIVIVVGVLGGLAVALGAALIAISFMLPALALLTTSFTILGISTGPIYILILVIGLLIAAGVAIVANWDWITGKASQIWQAIGQIVENSVNIIIRIINAMTYLHRQAIAGLLKAARTVAGVFSDDVANSIQKAIDAIEGGVPEVDIFRAEMEKASSAIRDMSDAATSASEAITETGEEAEEAGEKTQTFTEEVTKAVIELAKEEEAAARAALINAVLAEELTAVEVEAGLLSMTAVELARELGVLSDETLTFTEGVTKAAEELAEEEETAARAALTNAVLAGELTATEVETRLLSMSIVELATQLRDQANAAEEAKQRIDELGESNRRIRQDRLDASGLSELDVTLAQSRFDDLAPELQYEIIIEADASGLSVAEFYAGVLQAQRNAADESSQIEADRLSEISALQEGWRIANTAAQAAFDDRKEVMEYTLGRKLDDIEEDRIEKLKEAREEFEKDEIALRKQYEKDHAQTYIDEAAAELEAEEQLLDDLLELRENFNERILPDLERDAARSRADAQDDYRRDQEDAEREHLQRLADIRRNAAQKAVDAELDRTRDQEDIQRDYQQQVEDLHRKLGEEFFDTPDADIAGMLGQVGADTALLEAHNEGLAEIELERDRALQELEIDHGRSLQDIATDRIRSEEEAEIERVQKAEELRQAHSLKLEEIDAQHRQRVFDAGVALNQRIEDRQTQHGETMLGIEETFETLRTTITAKYITDYERMQTDHTAALTAINTTASEAEEAAKENHLDALEVMQWHFDRAEEKRRKDHLDNLATLTETWAGNMSARVNAALGQARSDARKIRNILNSLGGSGGGGGGGGRRVISGLGGGDITSPDFLHAGGMAMTPRLAVVGDVPEAIIPLDRLPDMMELGRPLVISFDGAIINGFDDFGEKVNESFLLWDRRGRQSSFRA